MRGSIIAASAIALIAGPVAAQPARLAAAPGLRPSAAYLIGWWSDNEDCSGIIEFRADGQFFNRDGTHGIWRLEGDQVTFVGTRTVAVRIVPRRRDEAIVIQPDGTLGYSRRCPRPAGRQ